LRATAAEHIFIFIHKSFSYSRKKEINISHPRLTKKKIQLSRRTLILHHKTDDQQKTQRTSQERKKITESLARETSRKTLNKPLPFDQRHVDIETRGLSSLLPHPPSQVPYSTLLRREIAVFTPRILSRTLQKANANPRVVSFLAPTFIYLSSVLSTVSIYVKNKKNDQNECRMSGFMLKLCILIHDTLPRERKR
jgi:hypothetical protein